MNEELDLVWKRLAGRIEIGFPKNRKEKITQKDNDAGECSIKHGIKQLTRK